jgi:hypothetical protein
MHTESQRWIAIRQARRIDGQGTILKYYLALLESQVKSVHPLGPEYMNIRFHLKGE